MDRSAAAEGITICDRRNGRDLPEELLGRLARCAAGCLRLVRERYLERVNPPAEVSVVMIDDAGIARVHGEFLQDPTPTDVITFPYGEEGEILVSTETAERQAVEYGVSFERELTLYVVHGLLHLCGYEDRTDSERAEMAALQEALVAELYEGP